jgi:hypothetical protein
MKQDVKKEQTLRFLVLPEQRLTVSDPCYLTSDHDSDALVYDLEVAHAGHMGWQSDDLAPGEWEAFAELGDFGYGFGERVTRSGIRRVDWREGKVKYKEEHYQGVDAGMVGYFIGEPALQYQDAWPKYGDDNDGFATRFHANAGGTMWCTESGCGDGSYSVNVGRNAEGKIVHVSTDFPI